VKSGLETSNGDLLEWAATRTRKTDPETSHEAAISVADRASELQRQVLAFAESAGPDGFTDVEMNRHFHHTGSTYRTRRSELVDAGKIVDSTKRRVYDGGRRHIVWCLTKYMKEGANDGSDRTADVR
jgi:hypothetical protein